MTWRSLPAVKLGYPILGKGAVVLTNNGYTQSERDNESLPSLSQEYSWPDFDVTL